MLLFDEVLTSIVHLFTATLCCVCMCVTGGCREGGSWLYIVGRVKYTLLTTATSFRLHKTIFMHKDTCVSWAPEVDVVLFNNAIFVLSQFFKIEKPELIITIISAFSFLTF